MRLKQRHVRLVALAIAVFAILAGHGCASGAADRSRERSDRGIYTYKRPSYDGIGKVYMGREISTVVGHRGQAWLERSSREIEERPSLLVEALDLAPDAVVADVGAGTGYLTFLLAPEVPDGVVLAGDIDERSLAIVEERAAAEGVDNVRTVLGTVDDPRLPGGGVDVVVMVDAYHEFSHPREMMEGVLRGLAPGGEVVLVEYRAEDPDVRIKPRHKMTRAQVLREMRAVGLELVRDFPGLPQQHMLFFGVPDGGR